MPGGFRYSAGSQVAGPDPQQSVVPRTMEYSLATLIVLPAALGLLGFVEPCTIGGHLIFLRSQEARSRAEKIEALGIFILARALVAGLFGALIVLAGQRLIGVQTGLWLVFGTIYLGIGLAFLAGHAGLVKHRIRLAPERWRQARHPVVLGLAFGLNIPACAAPILFGLLGLAASSGTMASGFVMMFLFGLALSAPLALFAAWPRMTAWLERVRHRLSGMRWILGAVFVLLGLWSIWFGLYVDPADWTFS